MWKYFYPTARPPTIGKLHISWNLESQLRVWADLQSGFRIVSNFNFSGMNGTSECFRLKWVMRRMARGKNKRVEHIRSQQKRRVKLVFFSIFQGKWFEVYWSEINEILRTLVRCLMYSREIKSIEIVCMCHSMLKRFFCLYSLLVLQRWHILFPNDQPPDASFNYICSRIEALFYDVDFPRLQNRNSLWGVKSVVNFPNRGGRAYITADIEYEGIYS